MNMLMIGKNSITHDYLKKKIQSLGRNWKKMEEITDADYVHGKIFYNKFRGEL